jgi:hypothetical protein
VCAHDYIAILPGKGALVTPHRTLRRALLAAPLGHTASGTHDDPLEEVDFALPRNVAQDDDAEDLYLVQLPLDGAGDSEAAAAVRKRIRALTPATVLTPVFLAWMRADEAAAERPQFSPKHPTGAPAH